MGMFEVKGSDLWVHGVLRPLVRIQGLSPDSPDEMAFGQLRASILYVRSISYDRSSSRILTDPTGERRNRQFPERFRGLRSCRPNPCEESGLNGLYRRNFISTDVVLFFAKLLSGRTSELPPVKECRHQEWEHHATPTNW